jgi:hypothetical protein
MKELLPIESLKALIVYLRNKLQTIEMCFFQRGGARIEDGLLPVNYSWPFASLSADRNRIIVTIALFCFCREYEFDRREVTIVNHEGLFSKGILITHENLNLPRTIVFWCSNRGNLLKALADLEYRIGSS